MVTFRKKGKLTKAQIRSKIFLKLKTQKEEDRGRKSRIIKKKLFQSLFFKKAKIVMFYISFGAEVDTREMIKQAKKLGKLIAVPVCGFKRTIRPCMWDGRQRLEKGHYGIPEPMQKRFCDNKALDLVIVPGVAFDRRGNRLGRGKGYYDKFLGRLPKDTPSIGLAFNFQILPNIPATPTDVSVHRVIFA
jgi:5-formyltetrahydrofolate cyclo-ligase